VPAIWPCGSIASDVKLAKLRFEWPALFYHEHDGQRSQRAEEKPGGKRQKRAVIVLADRCADADAKQRGDRPTARP